MKTTDQIVGLYRDREKQWGTVHVAGEAIRNVYNGEHSVILPELEKQERAAIANLVQTGIDAHAQRIASQVPIIDCPTLRVGQAAQKRATNRKRALQAWWYENDIPMKLRRRARHLVGYAMSPVLIRPGKAGVPRWEIRDPLSAYPAPSDPDDITPPDCIFGFRRSLRWLRLNYPDIVPGLLRDDKDASNDSMFQCLQYIDDEQLTMIALGREGHGEEGNHQLLSTTENLAYRPLVIVPGRITLDRLQGQFDQMIGMYETSAQLWALHLHAVKRGIFGERWLEGDDPRIVAEADPYTGEVGIVEGGQIRDIRTDPGFQQLNSIDRLEASQRQAGAVPSEFGGEGSGNVRTGRRGAQVMSAAVDFPIQEHQDILAASLQAENAAAICVAKAWDGNRQRTFVIPFLREPVVYTPNETFDTEAQFVRYSYSGTDTNGLVIEGGQRVAMETLSKQSFMENDPMVADPDAEHDRVVLEGIERAHLNAIMTQAADPAGPYQPADLARLTELIYDKNLPLYKAVQKLQEELQAAQAEAQQGQMDPAMMQPGLGAPGAPGSAAAGQAIAPPAASMQALTQTLGNLRLQQRETPAEQATP